jgi:hypothetical protein
MELDCSVTSHRSSGQPTHLAGRYGRRPPTHSGGTCLCRALTRDWERAFRFTAHARDGAKLQGHRTLPS